MEPVLTKSTDTGATVLRDSAVSIVQPTLTTASQILVKTMEPVLTKLVGTGATVLRDSAVSIVQLTLMIASQILVKTMGPVLTRSTDTGATVLRDSAVSIVQLTLMTAHVMINYRRPTTNQNDLFSFPRLDCLIQTSDLYSTEASFESHKNFRS